MRGWREALRFHAEREQQQGVVAIGFLDDLLGSLAPCKELSRWPPKAEGRLFKESAFFVHREAVLTCWHQCGRSWFRNRGTCPS